MTEEKSKRTNRVAQLLQRSIAQKIYSEIRDPRLPKWITISGVSVSKDLKNASVYFTLLEGKPKEVESLLNAAGGHLRKGLAKTLALRTVPQLHFIHDSSVEYGRKLSHLIDSANPQDGEDTSEHD